MVKTKNVRSRSQKTIKTRKTKTNTVSLETAIEIVAAHIRSPILISPLNTSMKDITNIIIKEPSLPENTPQKSGHVEAGKKWDQSEKGRAWKEQTIKAKEQLKNIIKERTGLDMYANQTDVFKYAGFLRDGNTLEAEKVVEDVLDDVKKRSGKSVPEPSILESTDTVPTDVW